MSQKLQGAHTDMLFFSGDVNPDTVLKGKRELNQTEWVPVESPQKNRRIISYEETEYVKRLINELRYVKEWDDSMFYVLAQAAQVEGHKIGKAPTKGPRGNNREGGF